MSEPRITEGKYHANQRWFSWACGECRKIECYDLNGVPWEDQRLRCLRCSRTSHVYAPGKSPKPNEPPKPPQEDAVFIHTKRTPVADVIAAFPAMGSTVGSKPKRASPLKAIRKHCKECSRYNAIGAASFDCASIKGCHATDCHFWPFRFGKRPEKMIAQGKGHLVTRKETP